MAKIKNSSKSKRVSFVKSRKQIRKEKRQQKKVIRNERYLHKNKLQEDTSDHMVNTKESKDWVKPKQPPKEKNLKPVDTLSIMDKQLKQNKKDEAKYKKLEREMRKQRMKQLQQANEEEDRVIRRLEKKLKLNRRKNNTLPKSFIAEGLDYLLEVCDFGSNDDKLALKKTESREKQNVRLKHFDAAQEDVKGQGGAASRLKNLQEFVSKENTKESDYDDDTDCDSDIYNDGDEEKDSLKGSCESESEPTKKKFAEDIYGRLRDEEGNIVQNNEGKYVPPQLREQLQNSSSQNSEAVQRLSKQMKGALNRLTESNLHSIATQIEDLCMKYSRNDINFVLLKLIKDSLITPVLSPERIVIEHAVLISVLHANVGTEIGAFILQHLVEELDGTLKEDLPVENKQIDNIILILSQFYNFKIFHASLMYEILNRLVEKFQEKDIELILLILKNVGFSLRKDDPVSLKELICNIQTKANESPALRENARVRFMLDTLMAVKNNNMLKIPNYDPSYVEHLKKVQQKSLLRPGKYVTELKISMEDLLNADTRGRWWIVGSAWIGGPLSKVTAGKEKESNTLVANMSFDQKILNLAAKQRMNTDTRRNIFCILMTAEDYIDAFEKLMKLDLKGQQYQEIIYVLMHCLLKEKRYNPYYAFVAEQFCTYDRKYQLAVQFCSWDKFKLIDSFSNQQITNLAKFLSYLFLDLKLPLSVLKVLQFTEMNEAMVKLIRHIMLTILLNDNEELIVDIFSRISKSEKLFMLREGLQLFLHHFMLKNIENNAISEYEEKLDILPKRVELAVNTIQGFTFDF